MCWALDLVPGGQCEQRQCRVDRRMCGSSLGLPVPGRQSFNVCCDSHFHMNLC